MVDSSQLEISPVDTGASDSTAQPLEELRLDLSWLVRLRWFAITGQALTVAAVHFGLGIPLPLVPLYAIITLEFVSNLVLRGIDASDDIRLPQATGTIMAIDLLLFTSLLYFTGGPFNPFSFIYLIHIAMAGLTLDTGRTWALVVLALGCSGLLFVDHVPLPLEEIVTLAGVKLDLGLIGRLVSFGLTASCIVYFMTRVRRALALRETALSRAREHASQRQRLAALATLAAGAAHELASPLSTIALVSKELERRLDQLTSDTRLVDDAQLIRDQCERCRRILQHMAADAGESIGEAARSIGAVDLVDLALDGLREAGRVDVEVSAAAQGETLVVPQRPLAQAIRGVLKNALDASQPDQRVQLIVELDQHWEFQVTDSGAGMDEEVLARAVEPFFTTKRPGEGMGLGLFLTRAILEQVGGELIIARRQPRGTAVTLRLPRERLSQA